MNNPVERRRASRAYDPVAHPAQPLANHRSDQATFIPERHETKVSSWKIFLRDEVRFDSLIPMELDPIFRDARASCFTTHEATRSSSSANTQRIFELAEVSDMGRISVKDGHAHLHRAD